MSGRSNHRLLKCLVAQITGCSNVWSLKSQVAQMSGRSNHRLLKCLVAQITGCSNVWSPFSPFFSFPLFLSISLFFSLLLSLSFFQKKIVNLYYGFVFKKYSNPLLIKKIKKNKKKIKKNKKKIKKNFFL
jgi:hypothetical protein